MKTLLVIACLVLYVQGFENLLNTDIHKCIECVCHARTGCWLRTNCARYQITKNMWHSANNPTIGQNDNKNADDAYNKCMHDENCILNTIKAYTDSFNLRRNCEQDDTVMDCRDRAALFMYGSQYIKNAFSKVYRTRFNSCAAQHGLPRLENNMQPLQSCYNQAIAIPAE